jgi:hypothetical protein
MQTFAGKAIEFFRNVELNIDLQEIEVMNPYREAVTFDLVVRFFKRFYDDQNKRTFIFGINPGRFGAGITGISFTDPINLAQECNISNELPKKHELSSMFIYRVIEKYGGAEVFYRKFFITAVSPLGFVKDGKNMNYYESASLQNAAKLFILETIKEQFEFGCFNNCAICVGGDKNFKFLNALNDELQLFEKIIPLEHPRFIMQYRRKALDLYLKKYLNAFKKCEELNTG